MNKSYTLQEIATAVSGQLIGDGDVRITRLAHPADIRSAEDLALAMDSKLLPLLNGSKAIAAVVSGEPNESSFLPTRIIVTRPRLALARLTTLFANPPVIKPGIHPTAEIEKGAKIGKNAAIGAFSYIGADVNIGCNAVIHPQTYIGAEAQIGDDIIVHPGVKIGAGTIIGHRVIIHFNASIGGDGFSFVTPQTGSVEAAKSGGRVTAANNELIHIASLAPVIIGDDVEIGANTSIDRGTIISTRIGNGTKIDNQVQIGHNVTIGENCLICGRVGIAGSASIGNRVVLGGATGVADHINIGDDAVVMAMSGVAGNIPPRAVVGDAPAVPREKVLENLFNISRLKQFFKKIDGLATRLETLEKNYKTD